MGYLHRPPTLLRYGCSVSAVESASRRAASLSHRPHNVDVSQLTAPGTLAQTVMALLPACCEASMKSTSSRVASTWPSLATTTRTRYKQQGVRTRYLLCPRHLSHWYPPKQRTCAVYNKTCVQKSVNGRYTAPGAPVYNVIGMAGAVSVSSQRWLSLEYSQLLVPATNVHHTHTHSLLQPTLSPSALTTLSLLMSRTTGAYTFTSAHHSLHHAHPPPPISVMCPPDSSASTLLPQRCTPSLCPSRRTVTRLCLMSSGSPSRRNSSSGSKSYTLCCIPHQHRRHKLAHICG